MKLAPLQRNSRRHVSRHAVLDDSPMAVAIKPVSTTKYVAIAPTSGRARLKESSGVAGPPSHPNPVLVAAMVRAPVAALNTVRCNGYGCFGLYVHWVQKAATAISMAGLGPSSSSDTRLAAYDTDSVDPLTTGKGNVTFQTEVTQANTARLTNSCGSGSSRGTNPTSVAAPAALIPAT